MEWGFLIEGKGRFKMQDWNELEIVLVCCLFHTRTEVFKLDRYC